jgi:Holliday junction resolvase
MPAYSKETQLANAPGGHRNRIARDVKHNKQRSQSEERKIDKEYKAAGFDKSRRVPMSGALHEALLFADVDPGEMFLVEAKMTRSGKLVLETEWLKKIKAEAASQNRKPLLHAAIALDEGQYERWVSMPEENWMQFLKEYKNFEEEVRFLHGELKRID